MLHKQVAVTDSTVTDLGQFAAIAATWSVDRTGEQIRKGAFAATIEAWRRAGKTVPVHWDHRGEAENVIGSVDAATMAETDAGLYVEGQLDLEDSDVAREAWRSMKSNRIALSFGYLVTADRKRDDGIRELLAIDLFEVTLTPSPANPETRILEMKAGAVTPPAFTDADWMALNDASAGAKRAHEQTQLERKRAEQRALRVARKARPVHVATFELE